MTDNWNVTSVELLDEITIFNETIKEMLRAEKLEESSD